MAKFRGAKVIIGVDLNTDKFEVATQLGMTLGVDGNQQDLQQYLMQQSQWGYDYTFDCTGVTSVMRMALEVAHRGWG